jgi:acetyl esterase/lipase
MQPLSEVEIQHLLDPEIAHDFAATLPSHLPEGEISVEQVRTLDRELAVMPKATGSSEWIRREDGTALQLRRYQPSSIADDSSVVLWIHGGGMFLGSARQDDALCQELCETLGVRIASVDYRLAPEHPYPEPLDDCYTALVWLAERYSSIVVIGASAGGGLAAGLALLARDRGGPSIAAVQLYYPMLDDRETESARRLANGPVWNSRLNRLGWQAYLAGAAADQYAAPARASDFSGLPPMYLDTGELDMFLDEDVAFVDAVRAAHGSIEGTVVPGAVHAWETIAPAAAISRETIARRAAWLTAALGTESSVTTDALQRSTS